MYHACKFKTLLIRVPWFWFSFLPSEIVGRKSRISWTWDFWKCSGVLVGRGPCLLVTLQCHQAVDLKHQWDYYLLLTTYVRQRLLLFSSLILQLNHGLSTSGWFLISQKKSLLKSSPEITFWASFLMEPWKITPQRMVFYTEFVYSSNTKWLKPEDLFHRTFTYSHKCGRCLHCSGEVKFLKKYFFDFHPSV